MTPPCRARSRCTEALDVEFSTNSNWHDLGIKFGIKGEVGSFLMSLLGMGDHTCSNPSGAAFGNPLVMKGGWDSGRCYSSRTLEVVSDRDASLMP